MQMRSRLETGGVGTVATQCWCSSVLAHCLIYVTLIRRENLMECASNPIPLLFTSMSKYVEYNNYCTTI